MRTLAASIEALYARAADADREGWLKFIDEDGAGWAVEADPVTGVIFAPGSAPSAETLRARCLAREAVVHFAQFQVVNPPEEPLPSRFHHSFVNPNKYAYLLRVYSCSAETAHRRPPEGGYGLEGELRTKNCVRCDRITWRGTLMQAASSAPKDPSESQ